MKISDIIEWYKAQVIAVGVDEAYKRLWNKGFNRSITMAVKFCVNADGTEKELPVDENPTKPPKRDLSLKVA